jgi:DNA invertase Pin-like site-specific DNA recombinase
MVEVMEGKTAIYCRVANKACDDVAVIMQKEILCRYAERQGYTDIECYEDIGFSGLKLTGRPAFEQLCRDIGDGKVQRVIVHSLSRIGRNTMDTFHWIDELHAKGVDIVVMECPTGSVDTLRRIFGTWMERAVSNG